MRDWASCCGGCQITGDECHAGSTTRFRQRTTVPHPGRNCWGGAVVAAAGPGGLLGPRRLLTPTKLRSGVSCGNNGRKECVRHANREVANAEEESPLRWRLV